MLISELKQDTNNANKGTKRGNAAVAQSLKTLGAGRSILCDKHGVIIAGNKSVSQASAAGIDPDAIVVDSDGSKLIVVRRTDLDLSTDSKAKALAIADNRTAELGLEWNPAVIADLANEMDLKPYFTDDELAKLLDDGDSTEVSDDQTGDSIVPKHVAGSEGLDSHVGLQPLPGNGEFKISSFVTRYC